MKKVVLLDKPMSYTPLQAIEKFKEKNSQYQDKKMSYAGRLDPMAEGLLLCLVGEENKNRDKYQQLEKEYEFEVLFGLSTDTYDVMGKVQTEKPPKYPQNLEKRIKHNLDSFQGKFEQEYPPYSSYRVEGKPLFWWAREGKLDEIELPSKQVEVKKLEITSSYQIESGQLLANITNRVSTTEGEFRQEKIISEWQELLETEPEFKFKVFKFEAVVDSGTYIRSIAHKLGQKLEMGALALRIVRTRIGEYELENAVSIN